MTRAQSERERHLVERARAVLPGGSLGNLSYDIVIERGEGSRIWDSSGNEYIDYLLGSGPMIVGHSYPEVVEAVREQLSKGVTFFGQNEAAILLAEEIVDAVPCADKVRFSSTGSGGDALRDEGGEGVSSEGQDTQVRGRLSRNERLCSHEHGAVGAG